MPAGSGLLVLALIGTTVVPYNLFLGSGLPHTQTLSEMRFGLSVAVLLGGVISMGILVVGSATVGTFSYPALADALSIRLGAGAPWLLGIGLFAAGLSSAITAPLASAITARSVLGAGRDRDWERRRGATASSGPACWPWAWRSASPRSSPSRPSSSRRPPTASCCRSSRHSSSSPSTTDA
jgi:Mn2+/Fe2+ NRAMP family transporter